MFLPVFWRHGGDCTSPVGKVLYIWKERKRNGAQDAGEEKMSLKLKCVHKITGAERKAPEENFVDF